MAGEQLITLVILICGVPLDDFESIRAIMFFLRTDQNGTG